MKQFWRSWWILTRSEISFISALWMGFLVLAPRCSSRTIRIHRHRKPSTSLFILLRTTYFLFVLLLFSQSSLTCKRGLIKAGFQWSQSLFWIMPIGSFCHWESSNWRSIRPEHHTRDNNTTSSSSLNLIEYRYYSRLHDYDCIAVLCLGCTTDFCLGSAGFTHLSFAVLRSGRQQQ